MWHFVEMTSLFEFDVDHGRRVENDTASSVSALMDLIISTSRNVNDAGFCFFGNLSLHEDESNVQVVNSSREPV